MTWRKLHELSRWDERTIFRLSQARAMRGDHSSQDWSAILKRHRSPPSAPMVAVALMTETIELHPAKKADQMELGAIAAGLPHWRIGNGRDAFDPRLPFRLYPLIGTDAFTKANSWRRRTYPAVLELRRAGQPYPAAWEPFRAALAAEGQKTYDLQALARLGDDAIGRSLSGKAASEFWRANR